MSNTERDEIELLLPWYVNGRLSSDERQRVEAALVTDAGLRKQIELIREELAETVSANEAVGAPASLNAGNIMARLAGETGTGPHVTAGWLSLLKDAFVGPARLPLRGVALAVALLLFMQGATLVALLAGRETGNYQTAGGQSSVGKPGTFAIVRFEDDAPIAELSKAMQEKSFAIVDGPKAGNLYTVRIGAEGMSIQDRDARIAELKSLGGLVTFAAPLQ